MIGLAGLACRARLSFVLDKVWLTLIVCAMLVWLVLMVARLGAVYVVGFIALALAFRYFGVDK